MRILFILFLAMQMFVGGCKQEVGFSQVDSTELPPAPTPGGNSTDQPPVVKIMQAPKDHLLGEFTDVQFEVIKGTNEIAEVICAIDKLEVPCEWLKGFMKLVGLPLGKHLFQVIAIDEKGLEGEASESWSVYQDFNRIVDELNITPDSNMTDILFVIDNSGSMAREQAQMSVRFANFMDKVKDLNWQIAITTTDGNSTYSSEDWKDGKLSKFENGDHFLSPALGLLEAQKLFAKNVKRKESGSNTEMGIYTTVRAIERAINPKSSGDLESAKFFRDKAALAVVVVSDEDEAGIELKGDGDYLINLVKKQWGSNKVFQFNSIIVHTQACKNGEGAVFGTKYERLSQKTNGIIGDVCAKNYSQMLKDIGHSVAQLVKSFELKCVPQDIDNDGIPDVKVKSKKLKPVPGYSINNKRIEFDYALIPGDYEFQYYCLK